MTQINDVNSNSTPAESTELFEQLRTGEINSYQYFSRNDFNSKSTFVDEFIYQIKSISSFIRVLIRK